MQTRGRCPSTETYSTMDHIKTTTLIVWATVVFSSILFCLSDANAEKKKLVVHEWGVTIRTATTEGTQLRPPRALIDTLPGFVSRHNPALAERGVEVLIVDKPVIHFYGLEGLKVTVKISTPKGKPLAYWPRPKIPLRIPTVRVGLLVPSSPGSSMHWTGTLSKTAPEDLAKVAADHWWTVARGVQSMYINTSDGNERFIFYEASAFHSPAVTAKVSNDDVTIHNAESDKPSGPVLLIVNDGGKLFFQLVKTIEADKPVVISRKRLMEKPAGTETLLAACRSQWESHGMTSEEARAIVEIWRADLIGRPGFLLISAIGRETYDKLFPIDISPKPDELVRTCMVFDTLSRQPARAEWLKGFGTKAVQAGKRLGSLDYATRERAMAELAKLGDLAEPFLKQLARSNDAEIRVRAEALLERFKPKNISRSSKTTLPKTIDEIVYARLSSDHGESKVPLIIQRIQTDIYNRNLIRLLIESNGGW